MSDIPSPYAGDAAIRKNADLIYRIGAVGAIAVVGGGVFFDWKFAACAAAVSVISLLTAVVALLDEIAARLARANIYAHHIAKKDEPEGWL